MIKLFLIIVLIEITIAATMETMDDLVPGNIISKQTAFFSCPENTSGNICADDCKTLLTCVRRTTIPASIRTCSDVLPLRPFCIPGEKSCSAISDSTIPSCSIISKFLCTNTGYFPDPRNCNQYHVCTEDSSETYECPPRYVYDAANFKCKRRRFARDCTRVNCVRSQNKYVVYSARKSYYAYCGLDGITMFRCADSNNFEFNPTTVNCEFVCQGEGTYPDYQNEQQFYECYRSRGRLVNRIQRCPNRYVYDAISKLCIKTTATTTLITTIDTTTTDTTTTDTTTTDTTSTDATITDSTTKEIITTDTTTTDTITTDTTLIDRTTIESDKTTTDITITDTTRTDTTITNGITSDTTETVSTTDATTTESMARYSDTFTKHQALYFNPSYVSYKDVETIPLQEPPNKSTLIDWLLHSK